MSIERQIRDIMSGQSQLLEADMDRRLDMLVRQGLMSQAKLPILKKGIAKLNGGKALAPNEREAVSSLLNSFMFIVLGDDTVFNRAKQHTQRTKYQTEDADPNGEPLTDEEIEQLFAEDDFVYEEDLEESLDESYKISHKSYTDAVNHAFAHHAKSGLSSSDDDRMHHVGLNSKKPSEGKTTRVNIPATHKKTGKKHMVHVQVYNKGGSHPYELNTYSSTTRAMQKEEVELEEGLPPHLKKILDKKGNIDPKKVSKEVHGGKKSDAKVTDVTPKGYGPNEEVELEEAQYSDRQIKRGIEIAHSVGAKDKHGAIKQIEQVRRGMSDHPIVSSALRSAGASLSTKGIIARNKHLMRKEEVEMSEAYKTPEEAKAFESGKKAARSGQKYNDNPHKEDALKLAWSKGHNKIREEVEIDEKVKDMDMGEVIKDFQDSDAPQFKGKSKEKRREMAIAAKLSSESYASDKEEERIKAQKHVMKLSKKKSKEEMETDPGAKAAMKEEMKKDDKKKSELIANPKTQQVKRVTPSRAKYAVKKGFVYAEEWTDQELDELFEMDNYKAKFQAMLKKTGKTLASMSDEEKKKFFNTVDAAHAAKNEDFEPLRLSSFTEVTKKYTSPTKSEIEADKKKDRAGKERPSISPESVKKSVYGEEVEQIDEISAAQAARRDYASDKRGLAPTKKDKPDMKHDPKKDKSVEHIVPQLRKAMSVGKEVTFQDGKSHKINSGHAAKFLNKYMNSKPAEKEQMQSHAHKSLDHFKKHV